MSVDRLSELPDSLLLLCLQKRIDKKEVVRTCLLSKRWRSLWADLPRLDFREKSTETDKIRRFVSVVHSALVNRTLNNLITFSVEFEYDECFASDVNTWLEFAANYNTKGLYLLLCSTKHKHLYELPQMMYSNSSLEYVSLKRCNLAPRNSIIEWPSLRSLELVDAELPQHIIENILSNSPVLDTLKLHYCRGFSCLDIKSQRLKVLDIHGWSSYGGGESLVEICAPNLEDLNIWMRNPKEEKLHLKDISSLSYVSLELFLNGIDDDDDDDEDDLRSVEMMNKVDQLLQQLQHVKYLSLCDEIIQIVSRMVASGWWLPRSSIQELTVTSSFKDVAGQEFCGIVGLLESYPKLEKLIISCRNFSEEAIAWELAAENNIIGDLFNLKTISIFDFPYNCCELLLKITRILLKKAIVLEKLKIFLYKWSPARVSEITQKLQNYPKSSLKAHLCIYPVCSM